MFTPPLPVFAGLRPDAPWMASFQAALTALQPFDPATLGEALGKSLDLWAQGSAALKADARLPNQERYCIRQSFLWQIYATIDARGLGAEAERKIYNRARDVIDETPRGARPTDLGFIEGENLIRNTLQHLQQVHAFYRQTTAATTGDGDLESITVAQAATLPALPGFSQPFLCTVVLNTAMDPTQARHFWEQFKALNTQVRLVTLGNDELARQAAEMADPIFFAPGGAQNPGRCLWVQTQAIQPDVRQWLQSQGYNQAAEACCIFIKATGQLSSVLKKSDIIDETAILDEFLNAI